MQHFHWSQWAFQTDHMQNTEESFYVAQRRPRDLLLETFYARRKANRVQILSQAHSLSSCLVHWSFCRGLTEKKISLSSIADAVCSNSLVWPCQPPFSPQNGEPTNPVPNISLAHSNLSVMGHSIFFMEICLWIWMTYLEYAYAKYFAWDIIGKIVVYWIWLSHLYARIIFVDHVRDNELCNRA